MKVTHDVQSTWPYIEVETALCLWEAWIDLEYAHEHKIGSKANQEVGRRLRELRGNVGSFTARAMVASIVDHCNEAWEAAQAMNTIDGCTAFDFEFCPQFLIDALDNGLLDQASMWQHTCTTDIIDGTWQYAAA